MMLKTIAIEQGNKIVINECIDTCEMFALAGSKTRAVLAGKGGFAYTCEDNNWHNLRRFTDLSGEIYDISLNPAGNCACLVGKESSVIFYDFERELKKKHELGDSSYFMSCSWSPDGQHVSVVSRNGVLQIWNISQDLETFTKVGTWKISEKDLNENLLRSGNTAWRNEHQLLVAGKNNLQVIEFANGSWRYTLKSGIKHDSQILMVQNISSHYLATSSADNCLKVWNLLSEQCLKESATKQNAQRIQYLPSKKLLLTLDSQGELYVLPEAVPSTPEPHHQPSEIEEAKSMRNSSDVKSKPSIEKVQESMVMDNASSQQIETVIQKAKDKLSFEEKPSAVDASAAQDVDPNYEAEDSEPVQKPKPRDRLVFDEEEAQEQIESHLGMKEVQDSNEVRPRIDPGVKKALDHLKVAPQKPIIVGGTHKQGRRNLLCTNLYGTAKCMVSSDLDFIHVEYSLAGLPKRIIPNSSNYTMASMNYRGVLLASKGYVVSEDQYENEELDSEQKKAAIEFISAENNGVTWRTTLPAGEQINAVILGNNWSAISTSLNYIRFFSPYGNNTGNLGFSFPVIALASFETWLAVLYHASFPFSNHQCEKIKIINTTNFRTVLDTYVVLGPESKTRWFGFSDQGILYVQDNKYSIWSMINEDAWIPVYDTLNANYNLWLIGVQDSKLIGYKLPFGEHEPSAYIDPEQIRLDFRFPLLKDTYKDVWTKTVSLEQERLRSQFWGYLKQNESVVENGLPEDVMSYNRDTIKTPEEIQTMQKATDKARALLARDFASKGQLDEAVATALQIETRSILEICLKTLESMKLGQLAARIQSEAEKFGRILISEPVSFRPERSEFFQPAMSKTMQIVSVSSLPQRDETSKENSVSNNPYSINIQKPAEPAHKSFKDLMDTEARDDKRNERKSSSDQSAAGKSSQHESKIQSASLTSASQFEKKKSQSQVSDLFRDLNEMKKVKR